MKTTLRLLLALLPLTTHAAIETWKNIDGEKMEAEFLSRKGAYVSFKKIDGTRYLYPYAKLDDADRARIDTLANPALAAATATAEATTVPDAQPAPATAGKIIASLQDKLVAVKGKSLQAVSSSQFAGVRYIAVYYSAHWCPPCRAFTPQLVAAYKEIKAAHPEFELIFVSDDEDEASMKTYMTETGMPWPAVKFSLKAQATSLRRPSHENGIPNLVFMDADGAELSLSFKPDGDYRGPSNVLADIRRQFNM